MAPSPGSSDPDRVHNGPSTQTSRITPAPRIASCCGTRRQVVSLTRDEAPTSLVELVRCSACGVSAWRLDGTEVDKARALGALSAAFAPRAPAPRPVRVRPAPTPSPEATKAAPAPEPGLAELLAGWSVFGTTA
jgi:hypothetical protein